MSQPSSDKYLVLGGSGLLGRHIVEQLKDRGDTVSVLDIVQRHDDVPFFVGDLCNKDQVLTALRNSSATCVIHVASPHATKAPASMFWKVNVEGTKTVIATCIETGVNKLVYTSSSGVVFNGRDIKGVDETCPYPEKPMDVYMETKVLAEKEILAANGNSGLATAVIRPSGIFGPGDTQLMGNLYTAYMNGRTGVQIGDNTNLADFTYVGNVAYAHVLAADKLTGSEAAVAGQIFFITNDDPWPFWDFMHGVWDRLDTIYPEKRTKKAPFVIPKRFAIIMATLSELIAWCMGNKSPTFTRFNVTFMCINRYHNIKKAKEVLGYKPKVSVAEGMDITLEWWKKEKESGKLENTL